jgi:hypothetical protein
VRLDGPQDDDAGHLGRSGGQQRPNRRTVPCGDDPQRAGEGVAVGEPVRDEASLGPVSRCPNSQTAAGSISAYEKPNTTPREIDEEAPAEEPVGSFT